VRGAVLFRERRHAGEILARGLLSYVGRRDVLVLGLPRGGVPVAYEVARALNAPLDVFIVRKLGAPGQPELAIGAIASGGVRVLNTEIVRMLGISNYEIEQLTAQEREELDRRERMYRGELSAMDVADKIIIVVDDGLATGSTMRAAAAALRSAKPAKIVVAVPVAARVTCDVVQADVDEVVCAATPEPFFAVGQWYEQFTQTTDDEVRELLTAANQPSTGVR
jgi:putative phosphoribosyl transferase